MSADLKYEYEFLFFTANVAEPDVAREKSLAGDEFLKKEKDFVAAPLEGLKVEGDKPIGLRIHEWTSMAAHGEFHDSDQYVFSALAALAGSHP
jgi:hypothetical protein